MQYRPLFIFVEGEDDRRFFDRIIKKILEKDFYPVKIVTYSQKDRETLGNYIKATIKTVKSCGGKIWFVHDNDERPSIEKTITKASGRAPLGLISPSIVIPVVQEIESWYLAGSAELLGKSKTSQPDEVTKEKFASISLAAGHPTPYECMLSILKGYDLEEAKLKSPSLSSALSVMLPK